MTHASLFSGIGGFDLAAQWAGFDNLFNCEIDPFCRQILNYHFPNSTPYGDITTTDFTPWRGRVDILTGGFPCQPFSLAGKRRGTEDSRHLFPQMLRAIREIRPRWVVGENVFGIINWAGGLVFEQVCADLEAEGYEVTPYILPACGVDAPHRRDRVWFIAKAANSIRCDGSEPEEKPSAGRFGIAGAGGDGWLCGAAGVTADGANTRAEGVPQRTDRIYAAGVTADAASNENIGRGSCGLLAELAGAVAKRPVELGRGCSGGVAGWAEFPTQSPVCRRDDGLPAELDGVTVSCWRQNSIKGFGNSIVPQVALRIFSTIKNYDNKKYTITLWD